MAGDLPQFAASNYTNTAYGLADIGTTIGSLVSQTTAVAPYDAEWLGTQENRGLQNRGLEALRQFVNSPSKKEPEPMAKNTRRLVKVIIMDPNENIPLDKCILYSGEEKLTDLDDQELFFELDIKAMLATHNEERVKIADKKVKERVEYLEPARIRDLKMVVVTVAQF